MNERWATPNVMIFPSKLCLAASLLLPLLSPAQLVRQANTTLNLPAELPVASSYITTNAITGQTFIHPICTAFPTGETNRLYVLERGTDGTNQDTSTYDYVGRIQVVNNLAGTPAQSTFMDLESYLDSVSTPLASHASTENGMLSLVFHPNYDQNGYFYVYFSLTISGQLYQRLARFQATDPDANPNTANYNTAISANPATMMPMLTIYDEAGNHNGGDLAFGADGYLYLSLGDEGGAGDFYNNARFINKDFWGQMLRIDVDNKPENSWPNQHSQPGPLSSAIHAGTYKVPLDNPFMETTTWHGINFAATTVRTEIYATGLRNPWRFTIDQPTGRIFLGDVGQYEWEEVNLIVKGGDYGWSWREGQHAFAMSANVPPRFPDNTPGNTNAPPAAFSPIEPIFEYVSDNAAGGVI